MGDPIKEFYEGVLKSQNMFSTETAFRDFLKDSTNQKDFFGFAKDKGYFSDESEYSNYFGFKKKDQSEPTSEVAPTDYSASVPSYQKPATKKSAQSSQAPSPDFPSTYVSPYESEIRKEKTNEFSGVEGIVSEFAKYDNKAKVIAESAGKQTPMNVKQGGSALLESFPGKFNKDGTYTPENDPYWFEKKNAALAALKNNSELINKSADDIINQGGGLTAFISDEDGYTFKKDKAIDLTHPYVQQKGGDNFVTETVVNEIRKKVEGQRDSGTFQKFLSEEYTKRGIDLGKQRDSLLNTIVQPKLAAMKDVEKERDTNIEELATVYKAEAKPLGEQYKAGVTAIQEAYSNGTLSKEDADAKLNELNIGYKQAGDELFKTYKKKGEGVMAKLGAKYERTYNEMRELEKSSQSYQAIVNSLPEEERKKVEDAYKSAEARIGTYRNEVNKIKDKNLLAIDKIGWLGKVVSNTWNGFAADMGDYLSLHDVDGSMVRWAQGRRTAAGETTMGQFSWRENPILRAITTTTSTIVHPSTVVGLATAWAGGGLGLPSIVTTVAGGTAAFELETKQQAGQSGMQQFEKTGNIVAGIEGAHQMEQNLQMLRPLYFLSSVADQMLIKKGIATKLAATGIEVLEEYPTEIKQQYEQYKMDGGPLGISGFVKENPAMLADIGVGILGQSAVVGGASHAIQKIYEEVPAVRMQMFADMIQKGSVEYAMTNLKSQWQTGQIDQKEFQEQTTQLLNTASQLGKIKKLGLNEEDQKAFMAIGENHLAYSKLASKEKNPVIKQIYTIQAKQAQQLMLGIANGTGVYAQVTLPGGGNVSVTMPVEKLTDEVIRNADKISVKNNPVLDNEVQKRKQAMGNPENVPAGFYENEKKEDVKEDVVETITPDQTKETIKTKFPFVTDEDFVEQKVSTPEEHQQLQNDLPESGFSSTQELETFLKEGTYGILTGQNPLSTPVSESANKQLDEKAKAWLAERNLTAIPVIGKFSGNTESSMMVPNMSQQQAQDFAKEFGQSSVAHSTGLIQQDGKMNPSTGNVTVSEQTEFDPTKDNYSTMKVNGKPVSFEIGYDFDNETTVKSPEQELTELFDSEINAKVDKVQQALESTGIKVKLIPDTEMSSVEGLNETGVDGLFTSEDGTIYLNRDRLRRSLDAGTAIYHEGTHPIINIIKNTQPELYNNIVAGLKEIAKTNKDVAKVQKWVDKHYADESQDVRDDEFVVETIGRMANGDIDIYNVDKGFLNSLYELMKSIGRLFGIVPKVNEDKISAFKELATSISDALRQGQDISPIVGAENVNRFESEDFQRRVSELKEDTSPVFYENAKAFANDSKFDNKLEFKNALQKQLDKHLPELKKLYGKDFDPSKYDEKTKQYLIDILTKEAVNALVAHPEAIGWYDTKTKSALDVVSTLHPEIATDEEARGAFILALAMTSNGNKVDKNFEYAEEQYKRYKFTERFDPEMDMGMQQNGIKKSMMLINSMLDNGLTMKQISDFFKSKVKAGDLAFRDKKTGKKVTLTSGENVDTELAGASVIGSKIGNGFFMNLWGDYSALTMDRWFMRTWGRLTGTLVNVNKENVQAAKDRIDTVIEQIKADPKSKDLLEEAIGYIPKTAKEISSRMVDVTAKDLNMRRRLSANPLTDELRKATNRFDTTSKGEKEAPANGAERTYIRDVFNGIQQKLKSDYGIDITMADLQASLWYPEKALYESFKGGKSFDNIKDSYSEDEAPDYLNAAKKLALEKGVTEETINEAVSDRRGSSIPSGVGTDTGTSEELGRTNKEVLARIRELSGGERELVTKKKAQARRSTIEDDKNFKLTTYVFKKKSEGLTDAQIASSILSVFPDMDMNEVKELVTDPAKYLNKKFAYLSPAVRANIVARAMVKDVYKATTAIDPAFKTLSVSEAATDAAIAKGRKKKLFGNWVNNFKNMWLDPSKGLPDWTVALKDFATGEKNLEVVKAENTIRRLQKAAKKISFTDWENFAEAIKNLAAPMQQLGVNQVPVIFDPIRAVYNKPLDMPPATQHPSLAALPASIKPFVFEMRAQIDRLTNELITSGYVTPEQAIALEKNLGAYVNRSYKAHNEKPVSFLGFKVGGYKPSKSDVKAAVKFIADKKFQQIASQDPTMDVDAAMKQAAEEAMRDVSAILDSKNSPYFGSSNKIDARNTGILKERQDIPEPIRKLMGEYTDPGTVFIMTVAKQASLVAASQYLGQLRTMGMNTLFFEKNDPKRPIEYSVEIAGQASESKSPLSGLYTTPDIKLALDMLEPTYNELVQAWMKVVGAVRWGKTVGSVVTQFKNFESNIGFGVMNGLFLTGKNGEALSAAKEYFLGQWSDKEISALTEKVTKLGLVGQNINVRELQDMLKSGDVHDIALDMALNPKSKWQKAKKIAGIPFETANKLYRLGDDFWKVYAYMNERGGISKAMFDESYDKLTPQQQEDVDIEASERVKNTWPTYDRVVELAKYVSKRAPIFGNFLSFQAESVRVLQNSVRYAVNDIRSSNKGFQAMGARRLAGIGAYLALRTGITVGLAKLAGFAGAGILGSIFGDDDEDRKKEGIKEALPPWMKAGDLLIIPGKEKGTFTVYNMSSIDPYGVVANTMNALTEGNANQDPGVTAAMSEFIGNFVNPEMTFMNTWDALVKGEDSRTGRKILDDSDHGFDAAMKVAGVLWNNLEPSTISSVERFIERDNKGAEAASFVGARPYDVNLYKSFQMALSSAGKKFEEIDGNYYRAAYKMGATEADIEEARNTANTQKDYVVQKLNRMRENFILLGAESDKFEEMTLLKATGKGTGYDPNTKYGILGGNYDKDSLHKPVEPKK